MFQPEGCSPDKVPETREAGLGMMTDVSVLGGGAFSLGRVEAGGGGGETCSPTGDMMADVMNI